MDTPKRHRNRSHSPARSPASRQAPSLALALNAAPLFPRRFPVQPPNPARLPHASLQVLPSLHGFPPRTRQLALSGLTLPNRRLHFRFTQAHPALRLALFFQARLLSSSLHLHHLNCNQARHLHPASILLYHHRRLAVLNQARRPQPSPSPRSAALQDPNLSLRYLL
ncbi:uncharacterized protein BDZ99DRAFT_298119 [Mytilinidion resinicola]|uniref:Uncharacterized protein n=1 Tax=Mytilinidion resinicola TaxID=574789 RepID=A0A6A6YTD6_9PEZI|nr:uncharacterized protein BDZ99DRAFT_298119 [Mytilinidion resinicola]KAF2811225.1 hypothetical protein BDZ99DRAFT_298119 [Mytilinidion resinicola]